MVLLWLYELCLNLYDTRYFRDIVESKYNRMIQKLYYISGCLAILMALISVSLFVIF